MSKIKHPWRIVSVYAADGTAFLRAANGHELTLTATDLEKMNAAAGCAQRLQLTDLQGQDARLLAALKGLRLV